MGSAQWRMVPVQPLVDYLGYQRNAWGRIVYAKRPDADAAYDRATGNVAGLRSLIWKAERRSGAIGLFTADRVACALGVHPCQIWDNWFDLYPVPGEDEEVA